MIEYIGNWLREGHIRPLERNGIGLPVGLGLEINIENSSDKNTDAIK